MLVVREFDILNDCWSGAKDTIEALTNKQLNVLEDHVESLFADDDEIPSVTAVNDFIWFETDIIAQWFGLETWEELLEVNEQPYLTWYRNTDTGELVNEDDLSEEYTEITGDEFAAERDVKQWIDELGVYEELDIVV